MNSGITPFYLYCFQYEMYEYQSAVISVGAVKEPLVTYSYCTRTGTGTRTTQY